MIGAGSVVFCKTLMSDIMATPALADSEFALMSPTETKLRRMEAFAKRMVKENGLPAKVWATTDRREAIQDADFVVVMIQVGGVEAFGIDYEIPLKYGVDQCIGDTLGPGGVFRGLRTIPVLVDIARDMEELAKPGAIMLQYANPMAANCLALGKATDVAVRRPLPRRADHAGPDRRLLRRAQGARSPTPAAASTTWTGSCRWSTRAATSTRCCARSSRSPSTTRTRRSAARSSATSATS